MLSTWLVGGLSLVPIASGRTVYTARDSNLTSSATIPATNTTTFGDKAVVSTAATNPLPPIMDPNYVCRFSYDDVNAADNTWWELGAGLQLDQWITLHGDGTGSGWFDSMLDFLFDGQNNIDCSTFGNTKCTLDQDTCENLTKQGKGQFFWILNAVVIFNNAVSTLHTDLQDETIFSGLDVETIFDDFNVKSLFVPQNTPSLLSIYGGSFFIAGGSLSIGLSSLTAAGTTASAFFSPAFSLVSFVGSIFSLVNALSGKYGTTQTEKYLDAQQQTAYYDLDTYNSIVREGFNITRTSLQDSLLNVLGYGDVSTVSDYYGAVLTQPDNYTSPIAQFFAGGKWLIKDLGKVLSPVYQEATTAMTQKLAVMAALSSGEVLLLSEPYQSESNCQDFYPQEGGNLPDGMSWISTADVTSTGQSTSGCVGDVGSCVFFAANPALNGTTKSGQTTITPQGGFAGSPTKVDTWALKQPVDIMNKIINKYGFAADGWSTIYRQSSQCQYQPLADNTFGSELALRQTDCFWNFTMNYTVWSQISSDFTTDNACKLAY